MHSERRLKNDQKPSLQSCDYGAKKTFRQSWFRLPRLLFKRHFSKRSHSAWISEREKKKDWIKCKSGRLFLFTSHPLYSLLSPIPIYFPIYRMCAKINPYTTKEGKGVLQRGESGIVRKVLASSSFPFVSDCENWDFREFLWHFVVHRSVWKWGGRDFPQSTI